MSDRSKLVVLKLDGDPTCQGVRVALEVGFEDERPQIELVGALPPAPQLIDCWEQWQQQYRALGMQTRIQPKEIIYEGSFSRLDLCQQLTRSLGTYLNAWLESKSFRAIDRRLREELSVDESIRVLIRTRDRYLQQLPWSLWDFCDRYPNAEVAIGSWVCDRNQSFPTPNPKHRVRILAILGNSQGIDLKADRQILNKLPDADVTWLVEPQRQQLSDRLWEQPWDLLFFAGHSETQADTGRIYLNSQESLSVEELKYALKRAIAKGLTVAIFNSCDGLGLARELERLGLSQTIFMREPVPDRVAQAFLKYFLAAFSRGDSFYCSVRQARERLQECEHRFPAASLLPVIYQNPVSIPPSWKSLQGEERKEKEKKKKKEKTFVPWRWQKLNIALALALLNTSVISVVRSQGILQSWELYAFDRLMQLRPAQASDRRILVITVNEADIQYQIKQGMKLQGSLADSALTQLLKKLAPHQPRAIGSDIIHDFPYDSQLSAQLRQMPYIAICRVGSPDSNLESIPPPPSLSVRQLGFTNFASDPDGTIRRQILGMTSDRTCQTDRSFSLQLALSYLKNPPLKLTSEGLWIDRVLFKPLTPDAGGYQLPLQDALGFQTLVNYRASLPQQVSLREILNGKHDKQLATLIKDRIVLIGVAGENQDLHATPYSNQNSSKIPGVMCHAQMISNIISAVADGRTLLWWWSGWIETIWLGTWSFIGALLVFKRRSHRYRFIAIAIATAILMGICYLVFLIGGWIPLVPSALGLILTGASVSIYNHFQAKAR
jgi:CHASE2 domain-containing sensor protein